MAQTTYQVILSTDGKHTVIATTDDAAGAKAATAWAKATYDQVVARYGLKYGKAGRTNGDEAVPECAVHQVPMTRQQGKYGPFWSCHERDEQGSFCSYRPPGE